MKKRIFVVIMLCLFLVMMWGCEDESETTLQPIDTLAEQTSDEQPKEVICVHVCGAVKEPGIYELPVGSRVYQAVQLAGGFRKKADTTGLNQASIVEDEMQIYVPSKKEGVIATDVESDKVNINTASKEELMALSGVGEAKAEAIIEYRTRHGDFKKIEDIMNISGIKEGMFAKIKGDITV